MHPLKAKALRGAAWSFLTQFSDQLVSLAVQIVLARLLLPDDFGTVALLSIFLALSNTLVSGGFSFALIQKKDADSLDFNTVFYTMLFLSGFMYAILFASAPCIASFYGRPIVGPLLRVLALQLFFSAFNGVQNAHLARELKMKEGFLVSFPAILANGAVGIGMALRGFGPWALVGGALSGGFVGAFLRWFVIGWRPGIEYSIRRLRRLFAFGSRLLFTGVLENFANQVYGLVIGKWYSASELAFFNKGDHLPHLVLSSVQGPIGNVAFPVLSRLQDNRDSVLRGLRKMIRLLTFFVFPFLFGLAAVAEPLVRVLLTDKWLPAVPFLRLACLGYSFGPLYMLNSQAMNALGRSDLYMRLEIVKKTLLFFFLVVTIPFGPLAMAGGKALCLAISAAVNAWPNRNLVGYSFRAQFSDVFESALLALAMGAIVWSFSCFGLSPVPTLFLQIVVGVLVYVGGSFLFRLPGLSDFLSSVPLAFLRRFDRTRTLQP